MTSPSKHVNAVLKMPQRVKSIGGFAQAIIEAMTGNALFPSPTPSLATLEADLSAFNAAEALALSRAKGAVESRNAKLSVLKTDLLHLMDYVQGVANAAPPASAEEIVQSSGFAVRRVGSHVKGPLTVQPGSVSGSAKVAARSVARRASYEWQFSTDQKTWTGASTTLQAKTDIMGLAPATTYYFRFCGITKDGMSDWSQVVSLPVV